MKKKILLIQPENEEIHRFRKRQLNNFSQITMPYLASFINEEYYEITLIDEYNQKIPYKRHFELVAITVNTANAPHCYEISKAFRKKGSAVVFGGPHATLLPEEAAKHCDTVLIGEGEVIWPRFLEDFYKGKQKQQYKSEAAPILANTPKPRWDLLHKRTALMKGAVFATRGCPYHCRYCNLKQIYHDCFRTRPIKEVIDEIKAIKSRHFVFWDDNFFADSKYALELMKQLAPLRKKWAAQVTMADCGNEELLAAARAAGCLYFFVGLESFSTKSLEEAGKNINRIEDYEKIIHKLHEYGIMIQAGIIFGFDSDDRNIFEDTLKACEKLGIDGATVSLLTPLPGTPIYADLQREGRLLTDDWSWYNGKTKVAYKPKHMTSDQLYKGYMDFRRKFYSLPSFFKRMKVSKTHLVYNLFINMGYRISIH